MDEKVKICFDKEYKIKAIDPLKFAQAEELEKQCGSFVEKISSFSEKVNSLVQVLELHASRIDAQKLRVLILIHKHSLIDIFLHNTCNYFQIHTYT